MRTRFDSETSFACGVKGVSTHYGAPLEMILRNSILGTYLRQDDYNMALLGELDAEFRIIIVHGPRYVQTGPLLRNTPFGPEQTSSVEGLILANEVFV